MPVLIKVYKNTNSKSRAYNKHYGKVVTTQTMSYQDLTAHMSDHNTVYGNDVCSGVAIKLQSCILEQLLEGKKVQFGDLGTFYLSAKCEGAEDEDKFNMNQNIKCLYLRFAPSRRDVNDLSSKALKKRATFMNVKDLVTTPSDDDANSGD